MLAEALGSHYAARWVGFFSTNHHHNESCPCHRIVRAGGKLGPYITGNLKEKIGKLRTEGVAVEKETVDLDDCGFDDFTTKRPLRTLRRLQQELSARVSICHRKVIPEFVGGVDVSYPNRDEGVAAYALIDTASGEVAWSTTVRRRVRFPYITTFFSFRELPILLELIQKVRRAGRLSPVVMVDGSGILHECGAGIATHLGVTADLPTIGVTKSHLCGQVDIKDMAPQESRHILQQDRTTGVALRPTSGSRRPIFISPGHRTNLAYAERLVRQLLRGRRLPEPLYWADRLGRIS